MHTGNLIITPDRTHHISKSDKNSYDPVKFLKNTGRTGGKLRPKDKSNTILQEKSIMNNTYFGANHYDIHLDMKLHNKKNSQEMSLSELETLHHLCEIERTQILQSIALAVLEKKPYAEHLCCQEKGPDFLTMKEIVFFLVLHMYKKITIRCN